MRKGWSGAEGKGVRNDNFWYWDVKTGYLKLYRLWKTMVMMREVSGRMGYLRMSLRKL